MVFRDRFNLKDAKLLAEAAPAGPPAPHGPGGPFAQAWRGYMKVVFKKDFLYKIPGSSSILYIMESKTLAGKEARNYEGEAIGRKLVVVFYRAREGPEGIVERVEDSSLAMRPQLLTLAEILIALGFTLPPDPERTSAETELNLEARYLDLDVQRFMPSPVAMLLMDPHLFVCENEENAETALAFELDPKERTKMVLARLLQRQGMLAVGESLEAAWSLTKDELLVRAAPLFPADPEPEADPDPAPLGAPDAAPVAPAAAAAPAAGRGRARGRGGAPVARGRGGRGRRGGRGA